MFINVGLVKASLCCRSTLDSPCQSDEVRRPYIAWFLSGAAATTFSSHRPAVCVLIEACLELLGSEKGMAIGVRTRAPINSP